MSGDHRKPLTDRQKQVLLFIESQIQERGAPPTLREIGKVLGVHTNAVSDHLLALERKGYIARSPMLSRNIRICVPTASSTLASAYETRVSLIEIARCGTDEEVRAALLAARAVSSPRYAGSEDE